MERVFTWDKFYGLAEKPANEKNKLTPRINENERKRSMSSSAEPIVFKRRKLPKKNSNGKCQVSVMFTMVCFVCVCE